MNYEFQALCRHTAHNNGVTPAGEPFAVRHICTDAARFERMLKQAGFYVVPGSITELRAVVDWEKPVWNLDEFAAAMGIRGGTLSHKKGDGNVPWSTAVNGVPRTVAMQWINKTLNPAGRALLDEP